MDILNILYAVLLMGGMAFIFGVLLTVFSKIFAVEEDPRIAQIRELLSGANCGACGYPGCDACAAAIVEGKAGFDACPVAGAAAAEKIAAIMGAAPAAAPAAPAEAPKAEAKPAAAPAEAPAPKAAPVKKVAEIDASLCKGCTLCKKNCHFDAIEGETKQPHKIIAEKCKGCTLCATKCPFKAITMKEAGAPADAPKAEAKPEAAPAAEAAPVKAAPVKKVAEIDTSLCKGCTLCKKNCHFDAIEGEVKQPHKIIAEKCKGCTLCATKCPFKAITMKEIA